MTPPLTTISMEKSTGGSSSKPEQPASTSVPTSPVWTRNHYSVAKLAEITLHDPKHAKRIMSNGQSAMRCHKKKAQYVTKLEKTKRNLEKGNTLLSAKLMVRKKRKSALTFENTKLKLHLQTMELKAQTQTALTDSQKSEIESLKGASGREMVDPGNASHGSKSPSY